MAPPERKWGDFGVDDEAVEAVDDEEYDSERYGEDLGAPGGAQDLADAAADAAAEAKEMAEESKRPRTPPGWTSRSVTGSEEAAANSFFNNLPYGYFVTGRSGPHQPVPEVSLPSSPHSSVGSMGMSRLFAPSPAQ